jgi:CBS domain-containing protein
LKWDFTRNLSLTTALFRVERGLFTSVDPNNVSQVITIPGSVTDGFEVQIAGQLTDAWAINAGYSYLDSTIDGGGFDGNRTLQTPEHMVSIWNEYQATDQLALALGVTYQDSYFVREDNAVLVPDYTRVDAAVFYDLTDQTRLQLNIENLLDEEYFPDAHSNDNISTGKPLNARITIRHQLLGSQADRYEMNQGGGAWLHRLFSMQASSPRPEVALGDVESYLEGDAIMTSAPTQNARHGLRLRDRPEFSRKTAPLTMSASSMAKDAVAEMAARNFGSVIIVDAENKVEGVVTERDILRRLVNEGRDPAKTPLSDIMTANPRTAQADDDMLEWLRMMSNERFRRLPVVDEDGRLIQVLTQGDFVSYTWPDLLSQASSLGKATVMRNFPLVLIGAGILIYPLILALALGAFG